MDIQKFTHEVFGELTTVVNGDKILVKANDVANALRYVSAPNAVTKHCRGVIVLMTPYENQGVTTFQPTKFIGEPDIYRLIFKSRMESAQKFQDWVFEEVLPEIRKHGMFVSDKKAEEFVDDPDSFLKTVQELLEERAKRRAAEKELAEANEKNVELNKDSVYLKKVMIAEDLVSTSHIANMVGLSPREVNKILEKAGVQYNKGGKWYLRMMPSRNKWGTQVAHDLESGKTVHYLKWTSIGKREVLRILDKLGYTPTSIKEAIKIKQQEIFPRENN